MRCPFCEADKEKLKVIDSRACEGGRAIRRRRQCLKCSKRFTTYERIEDQARLTVIKKDGSRVPWDRAKVLEGLERACYKRPVEAGELLRIVEEVEDEIAQGLEKEIPSAFIGQRVIDRLRRLDKVAYVRYASVYRDFRTIEELVLEAKAVMEGQNDDVPGQGRLFLDPPKSRAGANGNHGESKPRPRSAKAAGDDES